MMIDSVWRDGDGSDKLGACEVRAADDVALAGRTNRVDGASTKRRAESRKRRDSSRPPERPRLGIPAACSLAAAFLVVFAAGLALFATPAQAQTNVWSATLTPRTTYSGTPVPLGCDNTSTGNRRCTNSNTLSADDFTDDGTTYAVTKFFTRDGVLTFRLDTGATAATQGLTLVIAGEEFVFAEADQINGSKTQWKWNNTTLGWTQGTDVAVSLVVIEAPATGQPTISGAAQVSKTLTTATDDIVEPNGLPETPTFSYQWVRVDGITDTDIPGATSETYALTASDLGKQIKVKVSFTDARGHAEGPLTSDAYPPNGTVAALPGPCPAVNDWCAKVTAAVDGGAHGYEFDKFGSIDDNTIEYHGKEIDVWTVYVTPQPLRGLSSIYLGTFPRVPRGTVITLGELSYTTDMESEDGGDGDLWEFPENGFPPDLVWSDGQEVRVSIVLGSFPAEGAGTISGTARKGLMLTADVSNISDPDGLTNNPIYTYQWVRVDGTTETDIPGATEASYTPVADDVGKQVKLRVSFTDDRAHPEAVTSEAYPSSGSIGDSTIRSLSETFAQLTVQRAEDIGDPVRAFGTYSLGGEDADKFTISSSSGQLKTKVGERYDYEEKSNYSVTVNSVNQQGMSVSILVIINILDVVERPTQPVAPTVSATAGSITSLDVGWTAPENTGRPPITHYNVRYREDSVAIWTDGPQKVTGTAVQITGLTVDTPYKVQVQAVNHEGSVWSGDGSGRTDAPTVSFGASSYTAIEGVQDVTVTVKLFPAASRGVTILLTATPQGGATAEDWSGVPESIPFAAGETEQTFTITATDDSVDDDDESVQLGFGELPSGVVLGSPSTATVALVQDADVSTWYVWFGESSYTVTEGGTARISVHLNSPWKPELNEALTVPLFDPQHEGGASADDYSGVPESVTFPRGQTQASFTVRVTDDSDDDDGESVLLHFRRLFPDDLEVGRYGARAATLHIDDNDGETAVTVSFEAANYTAEEDGETATVRVRLDKAPGRTVTIPLTKTHRGATSGDYSGVPGSVTFGASETEKTLTVTATDDSVDDDRESVAIGFGSLPSKVSAGSPSEAVVQLTDNDAGVQVQSVQVRFDARAGAVRDGVEEGGAYRLGIRLSANPGVTLTIPLTYAYLGGATAADFSNLPANVTFGANATSSGVTIRPVDDFVEDPGESLRVSFGTLPGGVSVSSWSGRSTIIPVINNDTLPGLSVSDASAREWPNKKVCLVFVVTMDLMDVDHDLSVDYTTVDGTAVAGQDFKPISGTLVFRPAESKRRTASKSLCVEVIDDSHDEGLEEMTLVLSNPVRAYLIDGTGTGSISNTDKMPRASMARFGRTAAVHVVERVEERMAAPREVGFEGQIAGRQLRPGMEREIALDFLNRLGASAGTRAPAGGAGGVLSSAPMATAAGSMGLAAGPMDGMAGPDGGLFDRGLHAMGLDGGNLLTGSSFAFNRETRQGGMLSFWSRGARSSFAGREGALRIDGDVRTTMVGTDYAKGPMVVGLSLAHARGGGGYRGLSSVSSGEVASSVTGLYPWLGYTLSDRVSVWGVTGYGKGALTLTPGDAAALQSGLSMAMGAGGVRGELADSVVAGFGLAFKADALWVGTAIDGVEGPGGNLAAARTAVTRFRTGLEASRGYRFERGLSLQPSLEVGLRRDGGDAETGAGVDIGGGMVVSDRRTGLSADFRVRMLLAHRDEGFSERGMSIAFSFDPTPSTPLGFMAKVTPSWGGQATSGAQALWGRETMGGVAAGGPAAGGGLEAELGYGMPVWGRLVGTPRFGIGASEYGRDYRLGYGLTVAETGAMSFELGIDAARRESPAEGGAEHGVQGRLTARW